MKKLVLVAVGSILLLGIVAVAAVLVATGGDLGGWTGGTQAPAPARPGAAPASPAPMAMTGPTGAPGVTGPTGYPPGPRRVLLPPGRVKAVLTGPLEGCFRAHPMQSNLPAILTLDLEAQAPAGFAVLDVTVKSWGGAPRALVECAAKSLRGQVVPVGSFTPGDRATYDLSLDPPASMQPPPREPPPSTLPASRQQLPQRRGGSGR